MLERLLARRKMSKRSSIAVDHSRSYAVAPGNAGILLAADWGVDAPNCVTST